MGAIANTVDDIKSIELDWYSDDDIVRVFPRNQQRFEIQKDKAIEVLRLAKDSEQFEKQFSLLLARLAEWLRDHRSKFDKAILTLQDEMLAFVVVRNAAKYDEQFEDDLLKLDLDIARDVDLNLLQMKTLALPMVSNESLGSFLDERLVMTYHGERSRPH